MAAEDFANQIKFSQMYRSSVKKMGHKCGRYLNPQVAEYFSGLRHMLFPIGSLHGTQAGLPRHWTNPASNAVDAKAFAEQFPHALSKAALFEPIIALFA